MDSPTTHTVASCMVFLVEILGGREKETYVCTLSKNN